MVHSTWGDWFISEEIESTNPNSLSIWFLGCNGFVLRSSETTVYIDPYFGDGVPPRLLRMDPIPIDPSDVSTCDAIFVTHEHLDHMHPPSYLPIVENTEAELYASRACFESPDEAVARKDLDGNDNTITPGESIVIGDIAVYVREGNDPDALGEVTFIFEHETGVFFHGGDSRMAKTFSDVGDEFDIDLGVLAIGSEGRQYYPENEEIVTRKVYMDADEVIEVSNALKLDRLAPSHYGMWKGVGADISSLTKHSKSFEYPSIIEKISVGDRLSVDTPGVHPQQKLESK